MVLPPTPAIDAIFVGGPKILYDDRGPWQSSTHRERVPAAVQVIKGGIVGDKVTQPYHGSPDAALCVHLAEHYAFWNQRYGLALQPGMVGENLTVRGIEESAIYVGDVVRFGSVLAQVSGPRVPCANQARHIGRADWVKLTLQENRTGFYMRILEPGVMKPGDLWQLQHRPNEDASIPRINQCMYLQFDPAYAKHIGYMVGVGDWWRKQAIEKLAVRDAHWTAGMTRS